MDYTFYMTFLEYVTQSTDHIAKLINTGSDIAVALTMQTETTFVCFTNHPVTVLNV